MDLDFSDISLIREVLESTGQDSLVDVDFPPIQRSICDPDLTSPFNLLFLWKRK